MTVTHKSTQTSPWRVISPPGQQHERLRSLHRPLNRICREAKGKEVDRQHHRQAICHQEERRNQPRCLTKYA